MRCTVSQLGHTFLWLNAGICSALCTYAGFHFLNLYNTPTDCRDSTIAIIGAGTVLSGIAGVTAALTQTIGRHYFQQNRKQQPLQSSLAISQTAVVGETSSLLHAIVQQLPAEELKECSDAGSMLDYVDGLRKKISEYLLLHAEALQDICPHPRGPAGVAADLLIEDKPIDAFLLHVIAHTLERPINVYTLEGQLLHTCHPHSHNDPVHIFGTFHTEPFQYSDLVIEEEAVN